MKNYEVKIKTIYKKDEVRPTNIVVAVYKIIKKKRVLLGIYNYIKQEVFKGV